MANAVKLHVKKGDTVLVLSGKDKGKQGKIVEALPKNCLLYTSPSPRDTR